LASDDASTIAEDNLSVDPAAQIIAEW